MLNNDLSRFCFVAAILWGITLPSHLFADLIAITGAGRGSPSILYKVDPVTGTAWEIGDTGLIDIKAIAVHPTTGVLFAHQNSPTTDAGNLYTLDFGRTFPATIGTTHLGETHISTSDLTFSSDGTLYGWLEFHETENLIDDLVTFSKTTGEFTLVSDSGQPTNQTGLAFDKTGKLHLKSGGASQTDGEPRLFEVSTSLGTATSGAAIIGGNPSNTLDFDENNVAYTVERRFERQPDMSQLYVGTFLQTIDISSGAVSDVAMIQTPGGGGFSPPISAIAFTSFSITAVPEPASLAWVMFASLVILGVISHSDRFEKLALFRQSKNRPN
ncbi:MAG: hypothetical protein AB8B91_15145 [Rubripirellula sp.]